MINSVAEYLAYTERAGGANPSSSFYILVAAKHVYIKGLILKHSCRVGFTLRILPVYLIVMLR